MTGTYKLNSWRLSYRYRFTDKESLSLYLFDALAGGPGRAFDVALKLGYDVGDRWRVAAGYRTVEGGADVTSVYNFAWLHYGVASVAIQI